MTVQPDKPALPRQMLQQRRRLDPAAARRCALAAQAHLAAAARFAAAATVLLYWPYRGEVDTAWLAREAVLRGKAVLLPRVVPGPARALALCRFAGDPAQLAPGAYGIMEPSPDAPVLPADSVDLVVVPGVAFDCQGGRLGYGGGYYDRLLPRLRADCALYGLAFALQVVDHLPMEPHDFPVHGLATETGLRKFPSRCPAPPN